MRDRERGERIESRKQERKCPNFPLLELTLYECNTFNVIHALFGGYESLAHRRGNRGRGWGHSPPPKNRSFPPFLHFLLSNYIVYTQTENEFTFC